MMNKKAKRENVEKFIAVNPRAADYRFDDLNAAALRHFNQQGFVVIKNALNHQEVCHAKTLCWDFLRQFGWNRRKPKTWISGKDVNPKGIIWSKGAGQSPLSWYCRTRPRIIQIFADIWSAQKPFITQGLKFKMEDMITSFDGFSVFRPWYLKTQGAERWKTQSGWWHIDQNLTRCPDIDSIQGLVTLYDLDKSTGSTAFVPGSHLWVQQLCPKLKPSASDFVMLKHVQQMDAKDGCRKILVCGEAGDLVLWDSRLIHCNNPALLDKREMQRVHTMKLKQYLSSSIIGSLGAMQSGSGSGSGSNANDEQKEEKQNLQKIEDPDMVNVPPLLRNVVYICMSPKVKVMDRAVIRKRIKAFESHSTCSHWPHMFHLHWTPEGMKPRKVENEENALIKSLIGCDMLTHPKWKYIPDYGGNVDLGVGKQVTEYGKENGDVQMKRNGNQNGKENGKGIGKGRGGKNQGQSKRNGGGYSKRGKKGKGRR